MKYHISAWSGQKNKLGREMVPLDNPYIYFLFLLAIAYISPWMCLQSHQVHYGCMFYVPYICIFYLLSWIKQHRHFYLSITVFTSCAQFHLSNSFWCKWAVVRLTCPVFTLSKRPHYRSFQEWKLTRRKRTEATIANNEWESYACFQNWKSHSEISDVLDRNSIQSPKTISSYECWITGGLWIKNYSTGLWR